MLARHVFLSYSKSDRERARALVRILERAGWSVWWDCEQITPGEPYRDAIATALAQALCVVVLWSRTALTSHWVPDEADAARKRGALIPVLLDEVEPPIGLRDLECARLVDWRGESEHPELLLLLKAIASRAGTPSGQSQAIADAYFGVQRHLITEHTRNFLGRAKAEEALDHFLNTTPSGYFVIRGGPGLGKTALACHLAKERGFIHHFSSREGGRSDPHSILRSLLAQLHDEERVVPDSLSELTAAFHQRLSELAATRRPVVLLVDGLDELFSRGDETFAFLLIESLPEGLFIVVTSRPGEALDTLKQRIAGQPLKTYDLDPLESGDVARLIRMQAMPLSEPDVQWLVTTVQGNPPTVARGARRDRGRS
jgi:hypothetical protein